MSPDGKKAAILIGAAGALFALAFFLDKKAAASIGIVPPAPKPATPPKVEAPKAVLPGEPPPSGPVGTPPSVPGYDAITVPCNEGGELGIYDDIQLGRVIDASTDPAYLEQVGAALLNASPPCSIRGNQALAKAAKLRANVSTATEPPMGGLRY